MQYAKVTSKVIDNLAEIIGRENIFLDKDSLNHYSHDETEDLSFLPEVVVKPSKTQQISSIMLLCNELKIPVTIRGAGTGLSGGALPVFGGLVLAMERFNRIIDIDEQNLQATVEPGVITQVFQNKVREKGLFYPPDPASKGSCFLGGNLAESSGGPKAVKYGVSKDYVLNMEVVLANGEIIWTGANVLKNATGYNLTQLMIGSEGTLGVITKIVFRLLPHPEKDITLLVPFNSTEDACAAVPAIFKAGIIPSGMEFMERDAIVWSCQHMGIPIKIDDQTQAHLLIEVDGNDLDNLYRDCEKITKVLEDFNPGEILLADTEQQKNELWKLRRSVAEAVRSHSVYKEEDTVVPRAKLPQLLAGVKAIGKKYDFQSVCYGHAGDGNLHVNIIKGNMSDSDWKNKLPEGIREILRLCVSLGGTISGEHGIGFVQKAYLPLVFSKTQIGLMKGIKKVFDPNTILNPGKIFPEEIV